MEEEQARIMNEKAQIARCQAEKRATRCRHFNGLQHGSCDAGVCYGTLQAGGFLLPCLPWTHKAGKPVAQCKSYEVRTPDELEREQRELERLFDGLTVARQAIIADLDNRHSRGDNTVVQRANYVAGAGAIPCPACKAGTLKYSRAPYNGHIHAVCSTTGCVQWME